MPIANPPSLSRSTRAWLIATALWATIILGSLWVAAVYADTLPDGTLSKAMEAQKARLTAIDADLYRLGQQRQAVVAALETMSSVSRALVAPTPTLPAAPEPTASEPVASGHGGAQ